ncbi:MAG: hypothetical protein IPL27_22710 [Lewinellaceae bacterium]|nr:hypothetical protein [Lewinellaceae bacterium]
MQFNFFLKTIWRRKDFIPEKAPLFQRRNLRQVMIVMIGCKKNKSSIRMDVCRRGCRADLKTSSSRMADKSDKVSELSYHQYLPRSKFAVLDTHPFPEIHGIRHAGHRNLVLFFSSQIFRENDGAV